MRLSKVLKNFAAGVCLCFAACNPPAGDETPSSSATKSANITISQAELQSEQRSTITSTDDGEYLLSLQTIDSSTNVTLTLLNTGDVAADKIKAYSLSSPLSYAGGSYPGTGGTCTKTILEKATCTIVVTFSPTKIGSNTETLKLGYYNGKATRTFEKLFKGSGASAPTISTVLPSAGPIAGGNQITISGTQFFSGASVIVGGNGCAVTSITEPTTIVCTLAAHAVGAVDVVVKNIDNQSTTKTAGYTYQLAPTLSSISPSYGRASGGTTVTLTGTGFVSGAMVTLGGQVCSSVSVTSSTQLTCVTSAHAIGATDVLVTNADGQTSSTLSSAFTYYNIPEVSFLSPDYGSEDGGTTLTISGSEFVAGATVTIGGFACNSVSVNSSTQITCVTPAQSVGSYDLVVTNTNTYSTTVSNAFDYMARSDSWQTLTTTQAGPWRYAGASVWTGSKAIFWGGVQVRLQ